MHLVGWDSMACWATQGGLGVLDLGDMNKALAAIWIYMYTNNKVAFLKEFVCARSRKNENSLLTTLGNEASNSVLIGFVESTIGRSGRAREVVDHHFKILIGDERDTNFWSDNKTCRGQLQLVFPRVYALARNKSGLVSSFGVWEEGRWI